MKSEEEIKSQLEAVEERIDQVGGHDCSHLIGMRNGLRWTLDNE